MYVSGELQNCKTNMQTHCTACVNLYTRTWGKKGNRKGDHSRWNCSSTQGQVSTMRKRDNIFIKILMKVWEGKTRGKVIDFNAREDTHLNKNLQAKVSTIWFFKTDKLNHCKSLGEVMKSFVIDMSIVKKHNQNFNHLAIKYHRADTFRLVVCPPYLPSSYLYVLLRPKWRQVGT